MNGSTVPLEIHENILQRTTLKEITNVVANFDPKDTSEKRVHAPHPDAIYLPPPGLAGPNTEGEAHAFALLQDQRDVSDIRVIKKTIPTWPNPGLALR
jgi:hypothetical protein